MENEFRSSVETTFGENVFDDAVMKARLPKAVYKALKKTIEQGTELDVSIADAVANTIKEWAVEKGATHFTHWFQPLTNITAEKHDAFIVPTGDGKVILGFSGKELVRGEPDASSFPSGGVRATCAARGYTAWDCTSPVFVKEGTLYIPTAFISYTGEALDNKTPLLRSTEALSNSAKRILKLFGKDVKKVFTTVGPEQEYFLVPKDLYEQRLDLKLTGRTLFGAPSPKGQELDDQYFGVLRPYVSKFMHELDSKLWKLGIPAKTKHNEVAPAQHEMAPVFEPAAKAADSNLLAMELMKKIAAENGLACLLHEKPFDALNGSGKHINWSMATSEGENLLEPGDTPLQNTQFLVFLAAVITAVDEYAPLLRLSVASAGNDHRLGANEAPPAILSIFLGEELTNVLDSIETGKQFVSNAGTFIDAGAISLPKVAKDNTDRNRTSPFAFTGNKFEFRMCGSTNNIATPCYTLNTVVAEVLAEFAEKLEKADDLAAAVLGLVKETIAAHKRVIFNGNGYTEEWIAEAEKRGLPNIPNTVEAIEVLKDQKYIDVLTKSGVFTDGEVKLRYEVLLENYAKAVNIEALTALDMVNRQLLPATLEYLSDTAVVAANVKAAGVTSKAATDALDKVTKLADEFAAKAVELKAAVAAAAANECPKAAAKAYAYDVVPALAKLRAVADELETIVPADVWPLPTYAELLFDNAI